MKYVKIATFIAIQFIFSACATTAAGPDELDMAIRDASDYLNDNIPAKSRIVILNIQSDSEALSDYIIDELIANAINDRNFEVVDRQRLDLIRAEQNLQWSGEVDDTLALEIGKFFEAQTIVSGTVRELGDRYRMSIRALEVQTARVQGQYNRNMTAGRTITALMKSSAGGQAARSSNAAYGAGGRSASGASSSGTAAARTSAGPQNGIYTFWPRLSATRAGLTADNAFIAQITVTRDFMVIHYCRSAAGPFKDGEWDSGMSGFYDQRNFILQDLDNPSRSYNPISAQSTNNGMGRIYSTSFNRINSKRFKLTFGPYGENPPFVIEEIILGDPDS
jgi:TolB-like protein